MYSAYGCWRPGVSAALGTITLGNHIIRVPLFGVGHFIREPRAKKKKAKGTIGLPRVKEISELQTNQQRAEGVVPGFGFAAWRLRVCCVVLGGLRV